MRVKNIKNSRIMTGTRPTSPEIHFGHLLGYINPLIELQKQNELFLLIADQHGITDITETEGLDLRLNTIGTVKSWLARGIDTKKAVIYIQSEIPETSELAQILSCFVSAAEIDRTPSIKDKDREKVMAGLWNYPILQAADIAVVNGQHVPVGKDQKPHLEKARIMTRNFNKRYGDVLVVPEGIIRPEVYLRGTDGSKMSSSADNYISPSMDKETLSERVNKLRSLKTHHHTQLADATECDVGRLYASVPLVRADAYQKCLDKGKCGDCKKTLVNAIADEYGGFREKLAAMPDEQAIELLKQGTLRARELAQGTLEGVRKAVGMKYF